MARHTSPFTAPICTRRCWQTCKGLGAIDLRDGFEVTEVESVADGVIATGADGTQVEGSSLIAADGIWSSLRDRIAPHASLRFSGATAWRALLPRDRVPAPFDALGIGLWLGPRAHLVHYPVRGGKDVNIVAVVEGGSAKQGWTLRAEPGVLLPAFHRWASPAKALLESVENWRCWSLFRLKPLHHWANGRVALLGDAAHPVLPYLAQGAALAIEDAAALAGSLKTCGGDPASAFPLYEKVRMRRAARVQAHGGALRPHLPSSRPRGVGAQFRAEAKTRRDTAPQLRLALW